jgi:ABC-type sugar transport system permease subunit/outer membrane protein assembly factor BamB
MGAVVCAMIVGLWLWAPPMVRADGGTWQYAGQRIESAAMANDGSLVLLGSRDNALYALDAGGQSLWSFPTQGPVAGVDLSADATRIVLASEDRNLYLLDGAGQLLWTYTGSRPWNDVALAPDGSLIAAVSANETVVALGPDGALLWENTLRMPADAVDVYGQGDNVRLLVGNQAAEALLFARDGSRLIRAQLDYDIHAIDASANGALWAIGAIDGSVQLADGSTGAVLWSYRTGGEVRSVALSADGSRILAGSEDGKGYLLDAQGKVLASDSLGDHVLATAISADGQSWLIGARNGRAQAYMGENLTALNPTVRAAKTIGAIVGALAGTALLVAALVRFTQFGRALWTHQLLGARRLARDMWRSRISYLFLLPTTILLVTFNYYPFFSGFYHAFTRWKPGIETAWVGVDNFKFIFTQDPFFWAGIKNVVLIVLTTWLKALTIPLLVAEVIFHLWSAKLQYWMRTAFVIPLILPGVVTTLLWRNIYDPSIGLANELFQLLGLEQLQRVWLGDPKTALWALIFIGFPWAGAFQVLVYYGGLISIDNSQIDAAAVDGATGLKRIWYLDLPSIMGQIKLLLVLSFIEAIQVFQLVFLTTGGGPEKATYTPVLEMYYQAMRFDNFGIASAMGVFLFVIIMVGTIINMRYVRSSTSA